MNRPRPGAIHRMTGSYQLANGDWLDVPTDALILDVTTEEHEVRVLWEPMADQGSGYLPQAAPSETIWTMVEDGPVNWERSTATTPGPGRPDRVALGPEVGTYTARDEQYNGLAVLCDHARQTLDSSTRWREQPGVLRAELRRVSGLLGSLPDVRDDLIRRALAAGVPVAKLAADSGLSAPRIYQIRDGRR